MLFRCRNFVWEKAECFFKGGFGVGRGNRLEEEAVRVKPVGLNKISKELRAILNLSLTVIYVWGGWVRSRTTDKRKVRQICSKMVNSNPRQRKRCLADWSMSFNYTQYFPPSSLG